MDRNPRCGRVTTQSKRSYCTFHRRVTSCIPVQLCGASRRPDRPSVNHSLQKGAGRVAAAA